eukprot:3549494-Prymnesium_polylepis.1
MWRPAPGCLMGAGCACRAGHDQQLPDRGEGPAGDPVQRQGGARVDACVGVLQAHLREREAQRLQEPQEAAAGERPTRHPRPLLPCTPTPSKGQRDHDARDRRRFHQTWPPPRAPSPPPPHSQGERPHGDSTTLSPHPLPRRVVLSE